MKGPAHKGFVLVVAVAVMFIAGCVQQEPPSVKRSRAIAAENIELKKQLEHRSKDIEKLKEQHNKEIKKQEKLLAQCLQEKETWKKKSKQNIRKQVRGVLDVIMEENVKLREEIKNLKAQIEKLRTELEEREESEEDKQSIITDYFEEP